MTEERKHTLTVGRNIGATIGLIVFLLFGMVPAFHFGSYGTLVIISKLAGGPVEPGVLVRIALVMGITLACICTSALSIVAGSVVGTALAYAVDIIGSLFAAEKRYKEGELVINRPAVVSEKTRSQILSGLSFFAPRYHEIHSMILIGSAAYGQQAEDSDTDIVILCKDGSLDSFREFLFEKELEGYGKSDAGGGFEFTVLDTENTEKYFRMASPFAYALRNGVVMRDDGYFKKLIRKKYSMIPGREYFISAFYENISVQYYGAISKLGKEIKKNHCSDECCNDRKDCAGLSRGDVLAKTLMRMLYITLPARGLMPLSKKDVVNYSSNVYGTDNLEPLSKAIEIMRKENTPIYYSDYKRIKFFSAKLFREVLGVIGLKSDVIRILKNAARLMRGDYAGIDDEALKKCVM